MDVQSQIFGGMTRSKEKEDLKENKEIKKFAHKIQVKRQRKEKIQAKFRW
jgi:hypothetical protein